MQKSYIPKIKFCGLTNKTDVINAVRLGVDAIGFVLYDKSPRFVDIKAVQQLSQYIPAFVNIVALVVNPSDELIEQIGQLNVDLLQFHGDETPDRCQTLAKKINKRWIKAIRVQDGENLLPNMRRYYDKGAAAILLDAYDAKHFGGTGQSFDWRVIPKCDIPIILAGGLNADNVHLCRHTPAYAVDVSGGIERQKGVKCAIKMQKFVDLLKKSLDF